MSSDIDLIPDPNRYLIPRAPIPAIVRAYSNCAGMSPDFFYPERAGQPTDQSASRAQSAAIRAVCTPCLVREECLAWAVGNGEKLGWWGGVSPKDRARERRRVVKLQAEEAAHVAA